ncbi:hypothetical protein [Bosea sp. Root381]|uniref:hypothetical protein n=1 Tax=Bosea sp. Root381 TaxID=1736524 RepID=UPI0012E3CAAD|nr:hypothetical protein [Bosea sp. Root381]
MADFQVSRRANCRQRSLLRSIRKNCPDYSLSHPFADSAYDTAKLMDKAAFLDFVIEIVRQIDGESASRLCRGAEWTELRLDATLAPPRPRPRGTHRRLRRRCSSLPWEASPYAAPPTEPFPNCLLAIGI